MIIEIGAWVIRRAVDDLRRWRQLDIDPPGSPSMSDPAQAEELHRVPAADPAGYRWPQ
jgi:EAL domain-containing protein (putative c-di-GMP-specific phosphodiesterase class I)